MYFSSFYLIHHVWFLTKNYNFANRQIKQSEQTKQTAESDSDRTHVLELSGWELKILLRNLLKALRVKVGECARTDR